MTRCFVDTFDSRMLDKRTAKIVVTKPMTSSGLVSLIKKSRARMIVCITPFFSKTIRALESLRFSLVGTRVTYTLSVRATVGRGSLSRGVSIRRHSRFPLRLSGRDVRVFARLIGSHGRYVQDDAILRSTVEALYGAWIVNSLSNGYATETFYARVGDRVAGFITVRVRGRTGWIDLLGVRSRFQGMGIGSALVREAVRYCHARRLSALRVVAAGEHAKVNAFYERQGGVMNRVEFVYHKYQ